MERSLQMLCKFTKGERNQQLVPLFVTNAKLDMLEGNNWVSKITDVIYFNRKPSQKVDTTDNLPHSKVSFEKKLRYSWQYLNKRLKKNKN